MIFLIYTGTSDHLYFQDPENTEILCSYVLDQYSSGSPMSGDKIQCCPLPCHVDVGHIRDLQVAPSCSVLPIRSFNGPLLLIFETSFSLEF